MASDSSSNVTHINDEIDVIDEFCLISAFDEAAKYLSSASKIKLSNAQKLHFYALFKQATVGPCNKPQPSLFEFTERAKWSAWSELGHMKKDTAVVEYINALEQVAPQWKDQAREHNEKERDDGENLDDDDGDGDGGGGGGGGLGISSSMSRPTVDSIDESSAVKDICYFAEHNDIGAVKAALAQSSVTYQDSEGRTVLHIAADRGYYDIAAAVIGAAADQEQSSVLPLLISLRDHEGFTALHYACACDNADIAVLLVKNGALWDVKDDNGETAWTAASDQLRNAMTKAKQSRDANANGT